MEVFKFAKLNYYRYDDLVSQFPALAKGCRNKAAFIKKHNLPKSQYLCAFGQEDPGMEGIQR